MRETLPKSGMEGIVAAMWRSKRLKTGTEVAAHELQLLTECMPPRIVACFGQVALSGQSTHVVIMELMSGSLCDMQMAFCLTAILH